MPGLRPDASSLRVDCARNRKSPLGPAPEIESEPRGLLDLIAFGQQLRRKRRSGGNVAEVAVSDFQSGVPTPARALEMRYFSCNRFASHVQRSQHRAWAGE